VFGPGKPCQMFAGKTGAYPSKAAFKCSYLGLAPVLNHKYKTKLKGFPRTNNQITDVKHFITLSTETNVRKFLSVICNLQALFDVCG
jgi:hypothetical protein